MAPLAGKPPFATDEPDSFYETPRAPQPRLRQPAPADPNKRTSAYDVYDNYLADDKNKLAAPAAPANRNSGVGALGMGLLNMGDDSDSDDDDEDYRRRPSKPPGIAASPSKNAALAAATGVTSATRPSPPPQMQQQQQRPPPAGPAPNQIPSQMRQVNQQPLPPQQQMMRGPAPPNQQQQRPPPGPQPIAAPRPGYAAPIAALNLARPEAAAAPGGRQPMMGQKGPPPPINTNPFEPPFAASGGAPPFAVPGSPAPSLHSSTPHPLHPPMTPITPAFIRPSKSPVPGSVVNVSFKEGEATPRKPIMRGNSEETLLPSRGEKGDDFWRRFSMVVKAESTMPVKESSWLHKTRNGSDRLSRWVWVVGVILLICIAGGIGVGVYLTRNNPGHQAPTAIGGSADNLATYTSSAAVATGAGGKTLSSSLHVSPTNTVKRRDGGLVTPAPVLPPVPTQVMALRMHAKRRANAPEW
ncbi:hypothetical protein BDZ97DRAFT_1756967 [Flammula alnicola]|nr:hypothetical protein BDZ97DRAFT_1756967 [Flammula alnicola]